MANIPNAIINLGPQDINLSVQANLPAAGNSVTTPVLDMQAIAPNSNAWRLGRFVITIPNLPENNAGAGITVTMQVAPPSLTAGSSAISPQTPPPGVFAAPPTSQVFTVAAVAATGSPQQVGYMTLAFDYTGSIFEFYEFVIAVPAGVVTQGETINIGWEYA